MRVFIIDTFVVQGDSMEPTIHDGDLVVINRLAYVGKIPKRGDIVVVEPRNSYKKVIKRIIGLPGEKISMLDDGTIKINAGEENKDLFLNEPYIIKQSKGSSTEMLYETLDPKEYLIFGDNRDKSVDSKEFGAIDSWDIKGKVFLSI